MESLNRHFAAIAKEAFQRHGFASEQIAAQWAAIAGDSLASVARPERIKWPRSSGEKLQGGTLVLRAPAGRALEVHYEIPKLIERLNQFLGYGAIQNIKVVQTPDVPPVGPTPKPQPRPSVIRAWESAMTGIDDSDLKAALGRLGSQISPQGPSPAFSTGPIPDFDQPPTSSRKLT